MATKGEKGYWRGKKRPDIAAKQRVARTGPNNPNWKGGRYIDEAGYVRLWIGGKQIREHRLVMEKHLGRPLLATEEVHHINQIKDDNRIENLQLVIREFHFAQVTCPHCKNSFMVK